MCRRYTHVNTSSNTESAFFFFFVSFREWNFISLLLGAPERIPGQRKTLKMSMINLWKQLDSTRNKSNSSSNITNCKKRKLCASWVCGAIDCVWWNVGQIFFHFLCLGFVFCRKQLCEWRMLQYSPSIHHQSMDRIIGRPFHFISRLRSFYMTFDILSLSLSVCLSRRFGNLFEIHTFFIFIFEFE